MATACTPSPRTAGELQRCAWQAARASVAEVRRAAERAATSAAAPPGVMVLGEALLPAVFLLHASSTRSDLQPASCLLQRLVPPCGSTAQPYLRLLLFGAGAEGGRCSWGGAGGGGRAAAGHEPRARCV